MSTFRIILRVKSNSLRPAIRSVKNSLSVANRRRMLAQMANKFMAQTKATFGASSSGRPKSWPRLSPEYANEVGHSAATLRKTGALMDSLQIRQQSSRFVEIFTLKPYAWVHMFGDPARHIPPRPFFPVEVNGKSYRMTWAAEREILLVAMRSLRQTSAGQFKLYMPTRRMPLEQHPITSSI